MEELKQDVRGIKESLVELRQEIAELKEIMVENHDMAKRMGVHLWILERMGTLLSTPRLAFGVLSGAITNSD
jgi:hypothetical protein